MLMRGCGAWAVGLCESIRLGEGRSRPGLRVLRETAFNKVKLSSTRLGRVAMPRVLTKKRPTACSGGSTLRSTFVDQRHPEGSTAALSRSRATAGA